MNNCFIIRILFFRWLKRFWSCSSVDHELGQRDAMKLMKMLHPTVSHDNLKIFLTVRVFIITGVHNNNAY